MQQEKKKLRLIGKETRKFLLLTVTPSTLSTPGIQAIHLRATTADFGTWCLSVEDIFY